MIDLYTFATPNGRKVSILLEELSAPYQVHVVNIRKGEQFDSKFVGINPNSKIPAIVDSEGPSGKEIRLFESGAILFYLAEKFSQFLPKDPMRRYQAIQWLFFQMAGVGPMFGQLFHFTIYAPEKIPYAIERYTKETKRLLHVLDQQFSRTEFLAGEYSIADMAHYPWIHAVKSRMPDSFEGLPNLEHWFTTLSKRPAVERGMKVPES